MLLSIKKPIFVAVGNLCLKAFNARVAALTKEKRSISDPPGYIIKLREQREAAKARREALNVSRSKRQGALDGGKRFTTTDTDATWPDTNVTTANALTETQPQQYPIATQQVNPVQGSIRIGDDAFWLSEALDDGFLAGGPAEMMNLDTDAILAQDYWLDTPNGEVIDWAQWDTWFGNLDPIRPNISAGPG